MRFHSMAINLQPEGSMDSYELEIDEKSQVGSMFMARVANEIRRAAAIEKASRKLTQQAIADKIDTSRAVVNREMSGLENLSARRTAELLWAMGWEPYFEARKVPEGENHFTPKLSEATWSRNVRPAKPYQMLEKLGSSVEAQEIRTE
jgi:hypothetical protein